MAGGQPSARGLFRLRGKGTPIKLENDRDHKFSRGVLPLPA